MVTILLMARPFQDVGPTPSIHLIIIILLCLDIMERGVLFQEEQSE